MKIRRNDSRDVGIPTLKLKVGDVFDHMDEGTINPEGPFLVTFRSIVSLKDDSSWAGTMHDGKVASKTARLFGPRVRLLDVELVVKGELER